MEPRQEAGERIARLETHIEHITNKAEGIDTVLDAHEQDMRDFKEGMFQLRASSEAQLKTIEAAHGRIDHVDKAIEAMDDRVTALSDDFLSLKQRVTMIITVGSGVVTVFWAVFGPSVQKLVAALFGG